MVTVGLGVMTDRNPKYNPKIQTLSDRPIFAFNLQLYSMME